MEVIKTIGRRKTAIARAYLSSGKGEIKVNNRDFKDYFPSEVLQIIVKQPLLAIEQNNNFTILTSTFLVVVSQVKLKLLGSVSPVL